MTEASTEAILDTAKYLRSVRPLDPSELVEYVTAAVSVETVHEVLRSHAVELELKETPEGTFVPVAEPSPPSSPGHITHPPTHVQSRLKDLLESEYGHDWAAGSTGDALRRAIRSFKSAYFAGESVTYDRTAALGYAIYHLPGAFAKTQYVLDRLGSHNLLPSPLRVLEIGPGVGGSAMGLREYVGAERPIDYHGIEPSEAAATLCETFLQEYERNFQVRLDRDPIEEAHLKDEYDLIVLANVINELDHPTETIQLLVEALEEEGSLVAIAPADKRTSRTLRRVERSLVAGNPDLDVFDPTLRLWDGVQPSDDCWSFDVRPSLDIPDVQRHLDQASRNADDERDPATEEFVNTDVRYSHFILRKDGRRSTPFRPSRARYARLADSRQHVGERVNLCVVKLSHSLAEADQHPLFVIGDGSQDTNHFAVHTVENGLNRSLAVAAYGSVLSIESGLVLWNEDENAYNVVVDHDTIVDPIR